VFVLVQRDTDYIKAKKQLDNLGLVSQFMLKNNIRRIVGNLGPMSNVLRQVNSKTQKDLFRLNPSVKISQRNTMVVGIDVVNDGR